MEKKLHGVCLTKYAGDDEQKLLAEVTETLLNSTLEDTYQFLDECDIYDEKYRKDFEGNDIIEFVKSCNLITSGNVGELGDYYRYRTPNGTEFIEIVIDWTDEFGYSNSFILATTDTLTA